MASFDPADLAEVRATACAGKRSLGPGPRLPVVADTLLPRHSPPVRLRLLSPSDEPEGLLVYVHGGGWVMYSIDEYDRLGRHLAERTGWAVVMVDYPIAPEQQYPVPLDCCWDALVHLTGPAGRDWLADCGIVPPRRVVLGGDSAGGNLAAACALRARDAGSPRLAGQLLVYPVLDHDLDRPSYFRALHPDDISREEVRVCWDLYCPDPARRDEPGASPLRAASLAGSPPTLLVTADGDVLNDEVDAYGHRLRAAGVEVTSDHVGSLGHGCLSLWKESAEVETVVGRIARWMAARQP